jgi:ornithine decarboxylase
MAAATQVRSVERPSYASVAQLLRHKSTDLPVFCYCPQRVRTAVREFCALFPGEVLYAVKANPDREVLGWVIEGGVSAFDTASLAEMALVRGLLPEARCAYNHPIKSRQAIAAAYREWQVRDFVVDHERELEKVFECAGAGIVVQVRVATPNEAAAVSFNEKFGAAPEPAAALLKMIVARGATPALAMHVGWQTTDPAAYANGIRLLAAVAARAGVRPAYVNVGGGFPSVLMPRGLRLEDFFAAIAAAHAEAFARPAIPLRCEPGSALVTTGGAVLTQVLLIKEHAVYLNDGVYGALAELLHSKIQPPTRVLTPSGMERVGSARQFKVFGPTCDSYDVIPVPFTLPADTTEGDWLLLDSMGAYSASLITDFNGLGAHEFAIITG